MSDEKTISKQAEAAINQAARNVVEEARRSGGTVVIWKDGAVREIPGAEIDLDAGETSRGDSAEKR